MRRALCMMMLVLLPACGLAVTEGVVESAPQVAIEVPQMTTALFGAWEQGIADIRTAAARTAAAWKPGISELSLESIRLYNTPADDNSANDRIRIAFLYTTEERRRARMTVEYLRGTGEMTWISDTLDSGGEQHESAALGDAALETIAQETLAQRYGATFAALSQADDGENAHRWIARFDAERDVYEVCLDRQTGEVIRVSMYAEEEMP